MTVDEFNELKEGDSVTVISNFREGKVNLKCIVLEKGSFKTREVPNKPDQDTWKHMVHIQVIAPRTNFRNRTAWFDISHLEKGKK